MTNGKSRFQYPRWRKDKTNRDPATFPHVEDLTNDQLLFELHHWGEAEKKWRRNGVPNQLTPEKMWNGLNIALHELHTEAVKRGLVDPYCNDPVAQRMEGGE